MIANVILYQLGWAACVFGAANGFAPEGAVVAAAIVAWHISQASRPGAEALLAAAAAVLGFLFESALVLAGLVRVEDGIYWLVSLWALFATTLNVSLRALQTHPWIAALVGAIGGPLAYYAGARIGALHFIQPAAMLAALALGWAIAAPLLLTLARRLQTP